jgi:hypothetical protein
MKINLHLLPCPLRAYLDDLLAHDAGVEESPTGEMLRAYGGDRLTEAHVPALIEAAEGCLHIRNGARGEPHEKAERRKLTRFIGHLRTLDPLA